MQQPQAMALLGALGVLAGVWLLAGSPSATSLAATRHPSRPTVLHAFIDETPEVTVTQGAQSPRPRSVDCTRQHCLALTFDDGPDRDFTPRILDTLKRHQARATFFVLGPHAERHPDLVQREFLEGHEIGNHGWTHTDFTKLSPGHMRDEIAHTQQAITAAGVPSSRLFRPPYGAYDDTVLTHVPLTVLRWNIDPEDWKARSAQEVLDNALAQAKPGGVVLLHDTEQYTAEALDPLLGHLSHQYQLVTVSELFSLPPGQRGVYYGR